MIAHIHNTHAGSIKAIFPLSGLKTFLSKPYFSCSSCWWWCFLSRGHGGLCKNVTTALLLLSIRNIHSIWIQWTHGYFLPSRLVPMWPQPRPSRLIGEEFIIFLPMTAKQMELFQKFSNCFQQHIVSGYAWFVATTALSQSSIKLQTLNTLLVVSTDCINDRPRTLSKYSNIKLEVYPWSKQQFISN